MEIMEALKRSLQEFVLPELSAIRAENAEIKSILLLTNKRIDDVHAQLVDQSRRIDQTNQRIDEVRMELGNRIDQTNQRIDEMRIEVGNRIDQTNERIDQTNQRLDRLYEIVVRRDDHHAVVERVGRLEQGLQELRDRFAA